MLHRILVHTELAGLGSLVIEDKSFIVLDDEAVNEADNELLVGRLKVKAKGMFEITTEPEFLGDLPNIGKVIRHTPFVRCWDLWGDLARLNFNFASQNVLLNGSNGTLSTRCHISLGNFVDDLTVDKVKWLFPRDGNLVVILVLIFLRAFVVSLGSTYRYVINFHYATLNVDRRNNCKYNKNRRTFPQINNEINKMSNVDYDSFLKWATDHFGAENIRIKKEEILTHSPFCDDSTFNLWMNPNGGKKGLENGAFRCWKTDRSGSLVKLVSELDHIPYDEAEQIICGSNSLRSLEEQINKLFGIANPWDNAPTEPVIPSLPPVELPPNTYLIEDLAQNNPFRQAAERHLKGRSIPVAGLYVCIKGEYKNRIVIPYHDKDGDLIYWNARTLSDRDDIPKYMKPDDEKLDQTLILYMSRQPNKGERVYLTEGEFDAMSLNLSGLCGIACGGKSLSETQIEMLRDYIPVIATDNDQKTRDAGLEALVTIGDRLLVKGFRHVYYVRPPMGFKDWNALLHARGSAVVKQYIEKYTKPFTSGTRAELAANHL